MTMREDNSPDRPVSSINRRRLLASASGVVAGATAPATGQTVGETQPDDSTAARRTNDGIISSSQFSHAVHVSTSDDIQTKANSVPTGGRLVFEDGFHEVTSTITISKPITIDMSAGSPGGASLDGAVLENTTDIAPVIELTDNNGSRQFASTLYNPAIEHYGNGPAIEIREHPMTTIYDPQIDLAYQGYSGIKLGFNAWGTQIHSGRIMRPKNFGIKDESNGGFKLLNGTQLIYGASSNNIGMRAKRGWYINNADIATTNGLEIVGNRNYVRARFENNEDFCIKVGPDSQTGSGPVRRNIIEHSILQDAGTCVVFDHARDCMVRNPIKLVGSNYSAEWTANSLDCSVVGRKYPIRTGSWNIASGASTPIVDFLHDYRLSPTEVNSVNQPVEGMSAWSKQNHRPLIYDGGAWRTLSV
jgi:hypothetical protein